MIPAGEATSHRASPEKLFLAREISGSGGRSGAFPIRAPGCLSPRLAGDKARNVPWGCVVDFACHAWEVSLILETMGSQWWFLNGELAEPELCFGQYNVLQCGLRPVRARGPGL